MKLIETNDAPLPRGHYSQAVVSNGLVFVAGILPIIPNTNRQLPDGIKPQVEQVLNNLDAILKASGSNLQKLISVQIFIPNPDYWTDVNEVYAKYLGNHRPARTVIPCGPLSANSMLELNAVAEV